MIQDERGERPTERRVEQFRGAVMAVRTDDVVFGDSVHARDYVMHFGAVAVLAVDDEERVLIIQQYRHPVAARLWEIPAGLLDKPDEDPLTAAQRELAEEAGVLAGRWSVLVDYATTPGGSTELLRIYLASDLQEMPERPSTDEAEEQEMPVRYVSLTELQEAVLSGSVCNTALVVGTLAACASRSDGWRSLRPADDVWSMREHLVAHDRIFVR